MLHQISKNSELKDILNLLSGSFETSTLVKITLSKPTITNKKNEDVRNIFAKKIGVKGEQSWNLVYRYQTKDITKNFSFRLGMEEIEVNILSNFAIIDIFTTQQHFHILNLDNNFKVITKLLKVKLEANTDHNKIKDRLIVKASNQYLVELGLLSPDGQIKSQMQHKFKQINKYIESVAPYFKTLDDNSIIYDMGAGKGYLTFALYDYCINTLGKNFKLIGVEQRQELVTQTNAIASKCCFGNLSFEQGQISNYYNTELDVVIALHACDIATDEAIFAGIKNQAELIILAPCCQRQIRKDIETNKDSSNLFKSITKHGILFEKQAEILTDTIRSLILESCGYRTSVIEFIEWGETPKNTLIIAKKSLITDKNKQLALNQITLIKQQFSITSHYLETLIGR